MIKDGSPQKVPAERSGSPGSDTDRAGLVRPVQGLAQSRQVFIAQWSSFLFQANYMHLREWRWRQREKRGKKRDGKTMLWLHQTLYSRNASPWVNMRRETGRVPWAVLVRASHDIKGDCCVQKYSSFIMTSKCKPTNSSCAHPKTVKCLNAEK